MGIGRFHLMGMDEKIFGERFAREYRDRLEPMGVRFHERYQDRRHCLIRLTEAQNPCFADLDRNLPAYRAIGTPVLVMAGAEDRAIPPWVQQKLTGILPSVRFEAVAACGHVVYLEQSDLLFANVITFARTRRTDF